jgi:hypothetical protein
MLHTYILIIRTAHSWCSSNCACMRKWVSRKEQLQFAGNSTRSAQIVRSLTLAVTIMQSHTYKHPCGAVRLRELQQGRVLQATRCAALIPSLSCILSLSNLIREIHSQRSWNFNFSVSEFYQLRIICDVNRIYRTPVCARLQWKYMGFKEWFISVRHAPSAFIGILMIYCDCSSDTTPSTRDALWMAALFEMRCIP